jgi:hypothetical protein
MGSGADNELQCEQCGARESDLPDLPSRMWRAYVIGDDEDGLGSESLATTALCARSPSSVRRLASEVLMGESARGRD